MRRARASDHSQCLPELTYVVKTSFFQEKLVTPVAGYNIIERINDYVQCTLR